MIIGGGAVVVVLGIIIVASSGGTPPPPPPEVKAAPEMGWGTERVQLTAKWMQAIGKSDRIELAVSTDLDAFQKRFALGDSRMVSTLSGEARTQLKDQILDALLTKDETKLLREFEPYNGRLVDASMVTAATGRASLDINAKPEVRDRYVAPEGSIEVSFTTRDGKLLVDGFSVTSEPKVKVEKVVKPKVRHDVIKKPDSKVVERGGKKFRIYEAEVVPLEHLADTPPELRAEIDRLIPELTRADLVPRERSKIKARLRDIGKPAVPRLLTRFNDIKADSPEGVAQLTQIDALLRDMSGQAWGFSAAQNTVLASAKENEDARQSALKQWYAWWYYSFDKPLDAAFDKEDEDAMSKRNAPRPKAATDPKAPTTPKPPATKPTGK